MPQSVFVFAYLVCMLGVGVYAFVKVKTTRDFYTAGGRGSVKAVSGSLLATALGSSAVLGTADMAAAMGWPAVWLLVSGAIGLCCLVPIAGRVREYGHYTLPEMVQRFYGRGAEFAASAVIAVAWVGIVAAQIAGGGTIFAGLLGLSYAQGVFITAGLIILYTVLGGQLSIIKTDAFQSLLIVGGIAFVGSAALGRVAASDAGVAVFTAQFGIFDLGILLITYGATFFVGPDIYSRIFCAKDTKTAKISIAAVAAVLIPVAVLLTALGVYAGGLSSSGAAGGQSALIVSVIDLLPGWSGGFLAAVLLAAIMSSADTTLFTAASAVSELARGGLDGSRSILRTRFIVVVLGIVALVFALWVSSIIALLLTALAVFSGAFIIPVAAGLFGFRAASVQTAIAMIVGGSIALTGRILALSGYGVEGNIIQAAAFVCNAAILFWRVGKNT